MSRKLDKRQIKAKREAQKKRMAAKKEKRREILSRRFTCPAIEKMNRLKFHAPDIEGEIEDIILQLRKPKTRPPNIRRNQTSRRRGVSKKPDFPLILINRIACLDEISQASR